MNLVFLPRFLDLEFMSDCSISRSLPTFIFSFYLYRINIYVVIIGKVIL